METATPVLDGLGFSAGFDVVASNNKLRRPQADHELLGSLAKETGGAVIQPTELARLSELLPNRQVRVLGPIQSQPLWDKPFPLADFADAAGAGVDWAAAPETGVSHLFAMSYVD